MELWRKEFAKWLAESLVIFDLEEMEYSEPEFLRQILCYEYDPTNEGYFNNVIIDNLMEWFAKGKLDDVLGEGAKIYMSYKDLFMKKAAEMYKEEADLITKNHLEGEE